MKKILLTSVVGLMTMFGTADAGIFVLPRAVERALEYIYDEKNEVPAWFHADAWLAGMDNKAGIDLRILARRCEYAIDPSAVKDLSVRMKDVTGKEIFREKTDKVGICKAMIENVVKFHNGIIYAIDFLDEVYWEPDLSTKYIIPALWQAEDELFNGMYYQAKVDINYIESDILALYPQLDSARAVFRTSDNSFVCVLGYAAKQYHCRESEDSNVVFNLAGVATAEKEWPDPAMRKKAMSKVRIGSQALEDAFRVARPSFTVELHDKTQVASGL
jgi:hypothetical protein